MIPYSYEISSVDSQARVMEVVYSSPGRQTMHISARLPFVGETLEAVIDMFSPVAYWREQEAEVIVPELGSGQVTPPEPQPPTPEQTIRTFTDAIQFRLDSFARTRSYDGILSAATYATSTVPKFAAEGQYAVQARDATWYEAYRILAEVQMGTRPMPTKPEDIFPELPALVWPNER